jgi:hypothetical protein
MSDKKFCRSLFECESRDPDHPAKGQELDFRGVGNKYSLYCEYTSMLPELVFTVLF